jgi:hypothetical protein
MNEIILALALLAPETLHHKYNETVDIYLEQEVCDISDASRGFKAYATHLDERADGCWFNNHRNKTYVIQLEKATGVYIEYEIYRSKFEVAK